MPADKSFFAAPTGCCPKSSVRGDAEQKQNFTPQKNLSSTPRKSLASVAMEDGRASTKPPPAEAPELPILKNLASFTILSESFTQDETGTIKFAFTKFVLVDDDHTVWIGTIDIPKKEVTLEQAINCLRRVPEDEVYPSVIPGMPLVAASSYCHGEGSMVRLSHGPAKYSEETVDSKLKREEREREALPLRL